MNASPRETSPHSPSGKLEKTEKLKTIAKPTKTQGKSGFLVSGIGYVFNEEVFFNIVIISPVKQATDHLPEIVKKIEDAIVKKELIPTMDESFRDELVYFTNDEFENRIINADGKTQIIDFDELSICYNEDSFSPVDGKLVRIADHIAAFMEADRSIHHGITSVHLKEGRKNILKNYPAGLLVNGNDVSSFLMSFF